MRDEPVCFEAIRENAVSGSTVGREPAPVSGVRVSGSNTARRHMSPRCNVLSHLQALDDLLPVRHRVRSRGTHGLDRRQRRSRDGLPLLRHRVPALEELVADLRIIGGAAKTGKLTKRKLSTTEPLMAFINHTGSTAALHYAGRPFHVSHHHGRMCSPTYPVTSTLPSDGAYAR